MKDFKFIFISILTFFLVGCSLQDIFGPKDVNSVEATVSNKSSESISAIASTSDLISDNRCTSQSASPSKITSLNPNQSLRFEATAKCYGMARTMIRVFKKTNYNLTNLYVSDPITFAKFSIGFKFRITDKNHQNPFIIEMVPAPVVTPNEAMNRHNWLVSPENKPGLAWKKDDDTITVTTPKGTYDEEGFFEFDQTLNIRSLNPGYYLENKNGYYFSKFYGTNPSAIAVFLKRGNIICDNSGCDSFPE